MDDKDLQNRKAVAIGYEPGDNAPKVFASGQGELARRIIEKAKESDIPIHRDDKLAEALSKIDVGDEVPPEMYDVIVQVLMFVDRVDQVRAKMEKGSNEAADGKKQGNRK